MEVFTFNNFVSGLSPRPLYPPGCPQDIEVDLQNWEDDIENVSIAHHHGTCDGVASKLWPLSAAGRSSLPALNGMIESRE